MNCNAEFDEWYKAQRHQLANEDLCRLIFRRGWESAQRATAAPTRDEIIKLWDLAMLETTSGLDAMEYFARAILRHNVRVEPQTTAEET